MPLSTGMRILISLSLLWWALARGWPSTANSDPLLVQHVLAVMGLFFLVCGLWLQRRQDSPATRLFLLYCCLAVIHWAGPPGLMAGRVDDLLLGLFIVCGSALLEAVFLHLALTLPGGRLAPRFLLPVYLPPLIGALLLVAVASSLLEVERMLPVYVAGSAYGMLAGVVLLYRLAAGRLLPDRGDLRLLLGLALIGAWLPNALIAALLPANPWTGLSNLTLVLLPLTLGRLLIEPDSKTA